MKDYDSWKLACPNDELHPIERDYFDPHDFAMTLAEMIVKPVTKADREIADSYDLQQMAVDLWNKGQDFDFFDAKRFDDEGELFKTISVEDAAELLESWLDAHLGWRDAWDRVYG